MSAASLSAGLGIVDLITGTSIAASKREAREFVQNGAVSVNGEKVLLETVIRSSDLLPSGVLLLRRGKKAYHAVRVEQ